MICSISDWNGDKASDSLRWFADRGHQQRIAGYYDAPVEGVGKWQAAAKRVRGLEGIMVTTWQNDYRQREAFAKACQSKP